MVLQYGCLDNGVVQALGKSCLVWNWLVSVGGGSTVDLKLTVDTHILGKPEISLTMGGQSIFPPSGGKEKAKLKEDLKWQCPFRGQIAGVGELHRYELRPEHGDGSTWYPATVRRQRDDGLFEVSAQLPGGEASKEVNFPAVRRELLRDAESKIPVKPEMRSLVLTVPCKDPKNSTLTVDSSDSSTLITHFFARRTPAVVKDQATTLADAKYEPSRILLSATQNRSAVTCSVGHTVLEHFLSGEVRGSHQELSGHRGHWKVQIGPFAFHTIELERRYLLSQVFTLAVDGEILCEASAEDLESPSGTWECSFRFLGEKFLDWEVFEQTPAGVTLGTSGLVSKRTAYSHECVVSFPTDGSIDLRNARLTVDGTQHSELPSYREVPLEKPLILDPDALKHSYNLEAPVKYNKNASLMNTVMASLGISCGPSNGLFCCGAGNGHQYQHDTVVMPTRMDNNAPGILDPKLIYPQLDNFDPDEEEQVPQKLAVEAAQSPNRTPDISPEGSPEQELTGASPKGDLKPTEGLQGQIIQGGGQETTPQAKAANSKAAKSKCMGCTVQ